MRVTLLAVGRMKSGPDQDLVERYCDRFQKAGRGIGITSLNVVELPESRAGTVDQRKNDESERLLDRCPSGAVMVVLDERGKSLPSTDFANSLQTWLDGGTSDLCFVIGGADGLGNTVVAKADRKLAFGTQTWPHQIVRILLAEQLYRAVTILSGHPYHRA
ncbi:MAG: 23S rRNA (pseudouridine(1915)-N(3))-methyltransferase RlmH [Pseudomonadota bacterium]